METEVRYNLKRLKHEINSMAKLLKDDEPGASKRKATILCSIRAHMRGKLHMTKIAASTASALGQDQVIWKYHGTHGQWPDGTIQNLEWTMEDQERLVGGLIEDYRQVTLKIEQEPLDVVEEEEETVEFTLST